MNYYANLVTTEVRRADLTPSARYPKIVGSKIFATYEEASDPVTGIAATFSRRTPVFEPDYLFTEQGVPLQFGRDYSSLALSGAAESYVFVKKIPRPVLAVTQDALGCTLSWSHTYSMDTQIYRNGVLLAQVKHTGAPGTNMTYRDTVLDRTPGTEHTYHVINKNGTSNSVAVSY